MFALCVTTCGRWPLTPGHGQVSGVTVTHDTMCPLPAHCSDPAPSELDWTCWQYCQWNISNKFKKAKLKKLKPSILIYLCSNIYIIQKNVTHFSFLFTPELIFAEDNAMWIPLFKVSLAHFNSNEEDFIILYPHGFDCDLGDNGEWWRKEDRNLQYILHSFEILHTPQTQWAQFGFTSLLFPLVLRTGGHIYKYNRLLR